MKVKEIKSYKSDRTGDLVRDLSAFERNFILIAGGLLAFSITFIKDVVKIEHAIFIWILFLAWALITISLGLMMFTWLYSANASHKLWIVADDFIRDEQLFDDEKDLSTQQAQNIKTNINTLFLNVKKRLSNLRAFAVGIFMAGLVAFAFFIGSNLIKENNARDSANSKTQHLLIHQDTLELQFVDTIIFKKHI